MRRTKKQERFGRALTYTSNIHFQDQSEMQTRHSVTFRLAVGALACAGALFALGAQANSYLAVVPVSGAGTAGQLRPVEIALAGAVPPAATVGVPYEFNLGMLLSLDGPEGTSPGSVRWSVFAGNLPPGLSLVGDRVVGVPTEATPAHTLAIRATYPSTDKTASSIANYAFEVRPAGLVDFGSYRAWEDGTFAQSCNDYRTPGDGAHSYEGATGDGVYRLAPSGLAPFDASCDMTTDGGGWTVFQRRFSMALDFYRSHDEYVTGFGDPASEYWLGLERVHALTAGGKALRIDMTNKAGESRYAAYSSFSLGVGPNYMLNIQGYSGSAGDSLQPHSGVGFSTYDRDVDPFSRNCASMVRGAWWYSGCYASNLNGSYIPYATYGMAWNTWTGAYNVSLQKTEMKFR